VTDTQRAASEMMLVSQAIDTAIAKLDFSALEGKPVFLDTQYLDGTVDKGYLISSLRQHLLANGCLLAEERAKAAYVVEARSGGVGTDRHSLLVGVPQTTVPAIVPGQPTQIPEIPFAKKTDQNGVAKIAVFAYNRQTGEPVWQSGLVRSLSTARDIWVLGTGPFQNGSIRERTGFAGEPLPHIPLPGQATAAGPQPPPVVPLTQAATWPERPAPVEGSLAAWPVLFGTVVQAIAKGSAATTATGATKPAAATPTSNKGGVAETQPTRIMNSGTGWKGGG
jgi:hypothetical protein